LAVKLGKTAQKCPNTKDKMWQRLSYQSLQELQVKYESWHYGVMLQAALLGIVWL